MRKYKALVIGCGNIGSLFGEADGGYVITHAQAFKTHPAFSLEALVDTNPSKAKAASEKWGAKYFISVEEALASGRFDIISICVPTAHHREVLNIVSAHSPQVIILEKPISPCKVESEAVCADYQAQEGEIVVHYTRRFMPEFRSLKAKICSGQFGAFISGHCYYSKGLLNNGSHAIDLIQFFLGETRLTNVFSGREDFSREDPTLSLALSTQQGGVFCLLESDQRYSSMFEMDLLFEQRLIRISEIGMSVEQFITQEHPLWKGYKQWKVKGSEPIRFDRALLHVLDHAVEIIEKKSIPLCSLKDAMASQRLCAEALEQFRKSHSL